MAVTGSSHRNRGTRLLLEVLRERGRLSTLTAAEWDAFLPVASETRLLSRLAADAERLGLTSGAPDWVRDRLLSARIRGREFERIVRWEIDRIHRALLPASVRPVFLKGAGYIAAALPCGVGRVVADVDILVSEASLPVVEAALHERGWELGELDPYDERYYREWVHELPPMRHRARGTMLDVHHRILPRTGRVHPPTARLLSQALEVNGALVLSPAHMVLHSAAHLFQDGEVTGALRDVVDIRDLLEHFQDQPEFGDTLVAEAAGLGLGRALYYAVRYARLVGSRVALPDSERWKPAASVVALMDRLVSRALAGSSAVASIALYTRSHWLKMPAWMLARHLIRQSVARSLRKSS